MSVEDGRSLNLPTGQTGTAGHTLHAGTPVKKGQDAGPSPKGVLEITTMTRRTMVKTVVSFTRSQGYMHPIRRCRHYERG